MILQRIVELSERFGLPLLADTSFMQPQDVKFRSFSHIGDGEKRAESEILPIFGPLHNLLARSWLSSPMIGRTCTPTPSPSKPTKDWNDCWAFADNTVEQCGHPTGLRPNGWCARMDVGRRCLVLSTT